VKTIYVSERADERLLEYLRTLGREVRKVPASALVYDAVSAHPDIYMCALKTENSNVLIKAQPGELGYEYPACAAFNAVCLDKYFVHCLKYTNTRLLKAAENAGKIPVNVRQGYTKCSCTVVDGHSVITADPGIAACLERLGGVDVLRIRPGYVSLPGFDYGFLGGASGRVGDELIFSGDLSAHPDFGVISDFIKAHGVQLRYFPEYPLEDIGSIIEA